MTKNGILVILMLFILGGGAIVLVRNKEVITPPIVVVQDPVPVPVPVDNMTEPAPAPTVPVPSKPIEKRSQFNTSINLKLGTSAVLTDGLKIILAEINDSRCPKDAQCIWAGEISALLELSGGKLVGSKELRLGSINNTNGTVNGYAFTLEESSPTSIVLKVADKPIVATKSCFVGGCSGQICSDQEGVISTCEYREEYACYKTAKCERQSTGQCGWTPSSTLSSCLSE